MIAKFDDLDPLAREPGVEVHYIDRPADPAGAAADAACLPGYDPSSRLAMISAWISLVPSKMRKTRPSRQKRCAENSCE